ncbi:hypothetical protein V7S43_019074 [Phytophthora oleae]|uniref:Uncharacterized protein n=1 Tax=Phytophthora oleae TaxID=2107226 RepID=A0ABD3F7W8_9STRA
MCGAGTLLNGFHADKADLKQQLGAFSTEASMCTAAPFLPRCLLEALYPSNRDVGPKASTPRNVGGISRWGHVVSPITHVHEPVHQAFTIMSSVTNVQGCLKCD